MSTKSASRHPVQSGPTNDRPDVRPTRASICPGTLRWAKIVGARIVALLGTGGLVAASLMASSTAASAAPANWLVGYSAHVQNIGWQPEVYDGGVAGTVLQGLRMEALTVNVNPVTMPGVSVCYNAYVENQGWPPSTSKTCNGATAGTTGQSLRMEAVNIHLENSPLWGICYQAQVQNYGWLTPACDGQSEGTTGQSLRLEALRIWLHPISPPTYYVTRWIISPEFTAGFDHQQAMVSVTETKAATGQTLNATWVQTTHTWTDWPLWGFQATMAATPDGPNPNSVACATYGVGGGGSRYDTTTAPLDPGIADQFVATGGSNIGFADSLAGGACLATISTA